MHVFDLIAVLIFISGLFIFVNTLYLKLPSSVGFIILTLVMSIILLIAEFIMPSLDIPGHIKAFDFRSVLNQMVISVILFAGGLNMNIHKLGAQKITVIFISLAGAVISTFAIGGMMYLILGLLGIDLSFMYCSVFGAVISSTDPITNSSPVKRFLIPKLLETKVEGESLFNGAFSVVLAFVLYHLAVVTGEHEITIGTFTKILALELLGGISIGVIMGLIGFQLLKFIDNDDVHIEVLITIALVLLGSFISAYFSIYSKSVSIVMGLIIGNLSRESATSESSVGTYVYKFWNLMEEVMAVMLFVLMGLELLIMELNPMWFAAGFLAINVVFFGRWVSVYLPVKLLSGKVKIHKDTVSVMTWGALRGGLPIALILALDDFPGKELIFTMTAVVVIGSILFQGFTLPTMLRSSFDEVPVK